MDKHYISPAQLLKDSFDLAWMVFQSGFRPNYVVGVWRGGAPVGVAVHELLDLLGVKADHLAIRAASYTGMGQRAQRVQVHGLDYLADRLGSGDALLIVDDVHDTGLSIDQIIKDLRTLCGDAPEVRVATPYYKPGNSRTARAPDYCIHETDQWLVFPHELDGLTMEEIAANKPELAHLADAIAAAREQR